MGRCVIDHAAIDEPFVIIGCNGGISGGFAQREWIVWTAALREQLLLHLWIKNDKALRCAANMP